MGNGWTRYMPQVCERAGWMVLDHPGDRGAQWSAIRSIAGRIGCTQAFAGAGWRRRCDDGFGRASGILALGRAPPATSLTACRRWSANWASCGRPTRSCARHRPVQDRGHPPSRAMAELPGRRVRHPRMGRLVQPQEAAGAHPQHPASRSRGQLLRPNQPAGNGRVTRTGCLRTSRPGSHVEQPENHGQAAVQAGAVQSRGPIGHQRPPAGRLRVCPAVLEGRGEPAV
jgi:transposase